MRSNLYAPLISLALLSPLVFFMGLYMDTLGFKFFAVLSVSILAYVVMMVPVQWSLFFLFLYIGLEGFLKVISNYHPVVHVGSDLLVMALVLKVMYRLFFTGTFHVKTPPLTWLFVVYFFWLAIVFFNPYSLSVISSIGGAKIYVSMILLYFFGFYGVKNQKDIIFFMTPFLIVAGLHVLFGIYQGIQGPEGLISIHPRYAIQLQKYQGRAFRPFGLTNQPGGPAVYMYQVFPFALYFLFFFKNQIVKAANAAFIPLATFLFFLCQVRSALLKMIVASGLFLIGLTHVFSRSSYKMLQRVILLSSFMGLVLFVTLPKFFDYSIDVQAQNEAAIERSLTVFEYDKVSRARRGAWDRFVRYVQEVPFGAGFARVGAAAGAFKELNRNDPFFEYGHFFTDNFWVTALVEIGLPGMLLMTLIVFLILWKGFKNYGQSHSESVRILHVTLMAPLIALCIGLYGAEGLIYNPEACFFWFFAGVLMKLPHLESDQVSDFSNPMV